MVRHNQNGKEVSTFMDDSTSHPLYLHPNDNPGSILVTELLNGENYLDWSRSMHTALLAKNKTGFIDGSIPRPENGDPMLSFWIRSNSMVVSWLRNSTIPQIKSSLLYLSNAFQIWTDLKDRFSQGDDARIYHLKHQLFSLRQGSMDVNAYYTNLRIVWDEFADFLPKSWCDCGGCRCNSSKKWRDHLQKDFNMHFLMGLNDSYASLRTNLMSMDPVPGFGRVFSLVLQEERQRSIGGNSVPQGGYSPSNVSESVGVLTNAAQTGFGKPRDRLYCTHCGKTNHTVDKCFQIHGFPPGFGRGRGKSQDSSGSITRSVHNVGQIGETPSESASVAAALSMDQCSQLISFLQQQMNVSGSSSSQQSMPSIPSSSTPVTQTTQPNQSLPHVHDPNLSFSGFFKGEDDWDGA